MPAGYYELPVAWRCEAVRKDEIFWMNNKLSIYCPDRFALIYKPLLDNSPIFERESLINNPLRLWETLDEE